MSFNLGSSAAGKGRLARGFDGWRSSPDDRVSRKTAPKQRDGDRRSSSDRLVSKATRSSQGHGIGMMVMNSRRPLVADQSEVVPAGGKADDGSNPGLQLVLAAPMEYCSNGGRHHFQQAQRTKSPIQYSKVLPSKLFILRILNQHAQYHGNLRLATDRPIC
ncbi:hypothetical protein [Kaistia defluvii]|uniref:Uncharacterized protein n=1 Tax=Kaistia defluvii TaxID=410841 RepID=A0ABV2QYP6_9HYPH